MGSFKFSVTKKLYIGFLSVIIFLGILGSISINSMDNINQKTTEIATIWFPSVIKVNEINYYTQHLAALEKSYILEPHPEDLIKIEEEMNSTLPQIDKAIDDYEKYIVLDEERKDTARLKEKWSKYKLLHEEFIKIGKEVNIVSGAGDKNGKKLIAILNQSDELFGDIQSDLYSLVQLNTKGAQVANKEADDTFSASFNLILVIFIGGLLAGIIIAYIVSRIISKPLSLVSNNIKEVADGNLAIEPIVVKNRDEIGELAGSLNEMTHNLGELIRQAAKTSERVGESSEQLFASSEQTSKATEQISTAIQEVALGSENQVNNANSAEQSVNEISKGMVQVAHSIQNVSDLSGVTNQKANTGSIVLSETLSQMKIVQDNVTQTANIISELSEHSKEIGTIVDLISGIAEQTNLLALNAAIEAARAGEQGKGFAVVADEVRKLAEESSKATSNIHTVIQKIQQEINQVSVSMNEGTNSLRTGIHKVNETGQAFNEIVEMIEGVTNQAQEVSAVVEEVNANTEEMVHMITNISTISQNSAVNTQHVAAATEEQNASMEEIATSSQLLNKMAKELQENISKFKI